MDRAAQLPHTTTGRECVGCPAHVALSHICPSSDGQKHEAHMDRAAQLPHTCTDDALSTATNRTHEKPYLPDVQRENEAFKPVTNLHSDEGMLKTVRVGCTYLLDWEADYQLVLAEDGGEERVAETQSALKVTVAKQHSILHKEEYQHSTAQHASQ